MKKFMICLLTICLLSCSQNEIQNKEDIQNNDSLISDEMTNESQDKSSMSSDETDKHKEETDSKQENDNPDNIEDHENDMSGSDQTDIQIPSTIEFKETIENEYISVEINEIVGYEGFGESLGSRNTIEIPKLNFDTQDAIDFNNRLSELGESCKKGLRVTDETVSEVHFLNVDTYLNQDILSIVIKHDPFKNGVGNYYSQYQVHNFSISTGDIMTNEEIVSYLNLDVETIQSAINEAATQYRECSTFGEHEMKVQCIYTGNEEQIDEDEEGKSTDLIKNKYFYIGESESVEMYVFLFGAYNKFENIKIQNK